MKLSFSSDWATTAVYDALLCVFVADLNLCDALLPSEKRKAERVRKAAALRLGDKFSLYMHLDALHTLEEDTKPKPAKKPRKVKAAK